MDDRGNRTIDIFHEFDAIEVTGRVISFRLLPALKGARPLVRKLRGTAATEVSEAGVFAFWPNQDCDLPRQLEDIRTLYFDIREPDTKVTLVPLEDDEDYQNAWTDIYLLEAEAPKPGTAQARELETLRRLVERYEKAKTNAQASKS